MTDLAKKIKEAEKRIPAMMKTERWQKSVQKSDKKVSAALEKLRRASEVDPALLDEPATL